MNGTDGLNGLNRMNGMNALDGLNKLDGRSRRQLRRPRAGQDARLSFWPLRAAYSWPPGWPLAGLPLGTDAARKLRQVSKNLARSAVASCPDLKTGQSRR